MKGKNKAEVKAKQLIGSYDDPIWFVERRIKLGDSNFWSAVLSEIKKIKK